MARADAGAEALREQKSRIAWFFPSLLSLILFWCAGGVHTKRAWAPPLVLSRSMHAVISLISVMLPLRSEPLGLVMHLAEDVELALLLGGCL